MWALLAPSWMLTPDGVAQHHDYVAQTGLFGCSHVLATAQAWHALLYDAMEPCQNLGLGLRLEREAGDDFFFGEAITSSPASCHANGGRNLIANLLLER